MTLFLALTLALFWPFAASAQDLVLEPYCSEVAAYQASLDPAFKPGVDKDGKPVAPADLEAPLPPLEYPIEIPVEVDILKFMNLEVPDIVSESGVMQPEVAHVTVYEDGHIEYNGHDISDRATFHCKDGMPGEAEEGERQPIPIEEAAEAEAAAVPVAPLPPTAPATTPGPVTPPEPPAAEKAQEQDGQGAPLPVTSDAQTEAPPQAQLPEAEAE
jgi:hypothetical protein